MWGWVLWWCTPDTSGERLHGMQEVRGSIPLISTIKTNRSAQPKGFVERFCFVSLPFGPANRNFAFCGLSAEKGTLSS